MKTCKTCKKTLPETDFYANKASKDRLSYSCKECVKSISRARYATPEYIIASRARYIANKHKEADRHRAYYHKHKKEILERNKKYAYQKYSRGILAYAVKQGKVIKPTVCSFCGNGGKIEAHHADYSKPMEVIWLCIKCHHALHSPLIS